MRLLATLVIFAACAGDPTAHRAEDRRTTVAKGDGPDGVKALDPDAWGGPDPTAWKAEAVLANAAQQALDETLQQPTVVDATVAIPTVLLGSDVHPYGDGQSNAAASFAAWPGHRPPVVAVLTHHDDGARQVTVRWDAALDLPQPQFEVHVLRDGAYETWWVDHAPDVAGGRRGAWPVPADMDLGATDAFSPVVVRPAGWQDGFPLHFRHPVQSAEALATTAPERLRTFPDGKTLPDPEQVAASEPGQVLEALFADPRPGYNPEPFVSGDVHGSHPEAGVTAVGKSWTWVRQPLSEPFYQIYLCLEGRRRDLEAQYGVASGAGWHHIGDPAESLVNSVESAPLLTGWAHGGGQASLPGAGWAWDLGSVATFRYLQPGQALVNVAGTYHWYANPGDAALCAEIWVHPCTPWTADTFACTAPGGVDTTFVAQDVHTAWGESVYVVGSLDGLGAWDAAQAVPLSPDAYPNWQATVALPLNTAFEFKLLKKSDTGAITWQPGPNHVGHTANAPLTVTATW